MKLWQAMPFARWHPALWLRRRMPKGLFARALLIIITPMVLLQSVIAYTFMERHWQLVTQRLSATVTQDIAALVEMRRLLPPGSSHEELERIALEKMGLDIDFLPPEALPPALPKPFFEILDASLSTELRRQLNRPFFIDTVGKSNVIEIRVQLEDAIMRVIARRSQAYASNSHIFLVWMVGSSLILIVIASLFLRNQVRPVLRLGKLRQGARCRLQAARRLGSQAGRHRLPGNEAAHRTGHRPAHRHAQWRQP